MRALLSTKKWRENRDRASILLGLVLKVGNTDEAWQVYRQWADTKITFKEAEKRLRELAAKARA
ncbi:MAG: hypothetical protein LRS49_04265 [Desulfurococcales archaeon]|nr:hypothetical protein [Desulfurococcales archaeon]